VKKFTSYLRKKRKEGEDNNSKGCEDRKRTGEEEGQGKKRMG
jgi:hypothetical protein